MRTRGSAGGADPAQTGPVYQCGQCGTTQVEENRCDQCGRIMAKLADESCPDCQDESALTPVTAWEAGGELYESAEAAAAWEVSAPEREAAEQRSRRSLDEAIAASDARRRQRVRTMLPRMRALRERLDPVAAPRLCQELDASIGNMERGEDPYNLMLYFSEAARTLVPDEEDAIAASGDRGRDMEEREAIAARLRERMLERVRSPEARERIADEWFVHGSGVELTAEVATDALLETMEGVPAPEDGRPTQHPTKIGPGGQVLWMAHCSACGDYVDDVDHQPPADFLCERCEAGLA